MKITIQQSGYVSGDFLKPVAYAGEMNSRFIEITHPLFDNSFYQLLIIKENRPYIIGIEDGKCMLPPSLTDIACTLNCQFMALRKSDIDISSNSCDCYPTSSNDCSHMVFKSDKFTLTVAEGLSINGLTPIPPYEQLVDMYNNLNKAKLSVEKAKLENEALSNTISEKLEEMQTSNYLMNLSSEKAARQNEDEKINTQLNSIIEALKSLTNQINENKLYTISYYINDDEIINTQTKKHGETINLLITTPSVDSKVFVNWLDKENNKEYTIGELYSEDKDLKLYAIWE